MTGIERRRKETKCGRFFDWIDRRQMDAHCVTIFTLYQTYTVNSWAMAFANQHPESSAMVLAIAGIWTAFQLAAIKFIFTARKGSFEVTDANTKPV